MRALQEAGGKPRAVLYRTSDQVESIGPSKIIQVSVCDTFLMITGDEGFV